MKVKIPKEIKIGAWKYGVDLVRGLKIKDGYWGDTRHTRHTLAIDKDLPNLERDSTLIHEVLHIIDQQFVLKLSEEDITRLENGLAEFLFNNLRIEFVWNEVE